MSEPTSRQKKKIREQLRQRDGITCQIKIKCQGITEEEYRKQSGRDFDINHRDRNRSNWSLENLELGCHSCNCARDPRGKRVNPYFNSFNEFKYKLHINKNKRVWSGEQLDKMPSQMKASYEYKKIFPKVLSIMMESEEILISVEDSKVALQEDIVEGSAKAIGCSPEVALKYLKGECSLFGEYERLGISEEGKLMPLRLLENNTGSIYVRKKKQNDRTAN